MAQDSKDIKDTIGALDDYVLLGRSGLRISPLCLGTMSEQFLKDYIADKRSQVVLATKYSLNAGAMGLKTKFNPNAGGNHRKSLAENVNESLKRLGTGYIDLLYVHVWDFRTSIEEVMRSLDDVVRSGKVFYVAISDAPAWVVSSGNMLADLRGWSRFIGLQTRYNLLDRSLEFDLQPACAEYDVGIIPWGCVAEGFLTGKHTRESIAEKINDKSNFRTSAVGRAAKKEQNWKILDEVIAIAAEVKRTPVQVALNWMSQKPGITSPLVGARTKAQLVENLEALEFKLTPEQMARLDAVSAPNDVPFPYSIYAEMDKFVGKGIKTPEKYKPIFSNGDKQLWG
ncbi:44842_t:CDS:10 [Gigaspora margarita]|uniref:44842_t:CDS:1 n=1 Tax=Gigaspora margarita TaxID=4874 RepID=A0ABN7UEL5_GIGMA|nr:44842_t:CDS:10 [Gigaspora margarita]